MSEVAEQAAAVLHEIRPTLDQVAEVDLHEDRTMELRTPGFSRMRTEWSSEDKVTIGQVMGVVDQRILVDFSDAYALMNELFEVVREPVCDENGTVLVDTYGFAIWARTGSGAFVEDWQRLSTRHREDLIYKITTRLFEWEQRAANGWGEAMFAKAQYEERFALMFGGTPGARPTVDDRTQWARKEAREERYFAIYKSVYSRRADALCRVMGLLNQRLKDTLGS